MGVFFDYVGIGWAVGTAIDQNTDFSEWWYDWAGGVDDAFFEWVAETFDEDHYWGDACWDEAEALGGDPGYTDGGPVGPGPDPWGSGWGSGDGGGW